MDETSKSGGLRSEPDAVVSHLRRLLDLASWLAIDNMTRSSDGASYTMDANRADELMSLLIVARDYAEHELGEACQ